MTTWVRDENGRDWGWNPQMGQPNKANLAKLVAGKSPFAILWKYMQSGDKKIIAMYGDVPQEEIDRIINQPT